MASTLIEVDRVTGIEVRRPLRESVSAQERRALARLRGKRRGKVPPDAGMGCQGWYTRHPWDEPDR